MQFSFQRSYGANSGVIFSHIFRQKRRFFFFFNYNPFIRFVLESYFISWSNTILLKSSIRCLTQDRRNFIIFNPILKIMIKNVIVYLCDSFSLDIVLKRLRIITPRRVLDPTDLSRLRLIGWNLYSSAAVNNFAPYI